MTESKIAVIWLRSQATDLRNVARKKRGAYAPTTILGQRCERVAAAYERAAKLLEDEATAIESEGATP